MVNVVCARDSPGVRALARGAVYSRAKIDTLREAVAKELGGFDRLVNIARGAVKRPTLDVSKEEWNRITDVNLTSMLCPANRFFILSAHKRGRIINIGSLAAFAFLFEVVTYNSLKD